MQETQAPPSLPQITLYQRWLREQRGLTFESYDALWTWSVTDLGGFWQSIWDYFDLRSSTAYTAVCDRSPGIAWSMSSGSPERGLITRSRSSGM